MIGVELAKNIAAELGMSGKLFREVKDYFAKLDVIMSWASSGSLDPQFDRVRSNLLEISGDFTAHGADINANNFKADGDSRFNLQANSVTEGALWLDGDLGNVVVEQLVPGNQIVFTTVDNQWSMYHSGVGNAVFVFGANGALQMKSTASDPAYVDGYLLLYFYSDGAGTDELRVRGKIGATETQVTLANLSP